MRVAAVTSVLAACGGDDTSAFPVELDGSADDAAVGFDSTTAVDAAADTGIADAGAPDRPRADSQVVCPASCTVNNDCDPCRTSDQPATVRYCCTSGLCISMTGSCPTATGDVPSADAANDGAGGDGAPADSAAADPDALSVDDGSTGPDDATTTPDAPTADDLGGADGGSDAATVGDATASMDAPADGG